MLGQIDHLVRAHWPAWDLGPQPRRHTLSYALIPGRGGNSKIVCFCWTAGASQPCLVIKFPRTPQANPRLAAEHTALVALQTYLPGGLRRVPRPLLCTELAGLQVTVETALRGRPLHAHLAEHRTSPAATLRHLTPLVAWLTKLQVRSTRQATASELHAQVLAPLATAAADLAASPAEGHVLAALHEQAARLAIRTPLPLVFSHNDAGPPNILVDAHGTFTGLIDWESGTLGLPATDLLYLLARVADTVQTGGYERLFFTTGPATARVRAWLAIYCRHLGLAPAWLPVLFALGWLGHAQNEQRQQRTALAPGAGFTGRAADAESRPAHNVALLPFRRQLRFYLEHLDGCWVTPLGAPGA